jgi:hypothetical protein
MSRFDSPQEEAAHYREKYRRILDMLDETRAELGMSTSQAVCLKGVELIF